VGGCDVGGSVMGGGCQKVRGWCTSEAESVAKKEKYMCIEGSDICI